MKIKYTSMKMINYVNKHKFFYKKLSKIELHQKSKDNLISPLQVPFMEVINKIILDNSNQKGLFEKIHDSYK